MRFMGMGRNNMEFLEVKIPEARPVNMAKLSEDELHAELEKGYADMTEQADCDLRGIYEYIAFELLSPWNAAGQLERLEECIIGLY